MPGLHIDNHMADTPQEPLNACTNLVFVHIHAIDGVISSDQTGRFPSAPTVFPNTAIKRT